MALRAKRTASEKFAVWSSVSIRLRNFPRSWDSFGAEYAVELKNQQT
jgi:hypothetical protein